MANLKHTVWCLLFVGAGLLARADHITGGQMFYSLSGFSNGKYTYDVTLQLYMRCNSGRQFNNPTIVSVFDRINGSRITDLSVSLSGQDNITLPSNSNPCVSNPPLVCYDVGLYHFSVTLPPSSNGYIIASQVNYRIAGINNLSPGYGLIGATYAAEIPGTSGIANGPQNNSAQFVGTDLVMVCADNPFTYSFAANDGDNDKLRYSFCGAYVSGNSGTVAPPPAPPFQYVPYGSGYSMNSPLGVNVKIDQNTGLITGTAPEAGVYVVTVCVDEIRNGTVIATQRKDLQIFIAPCTIAAAMLEPEYMLCRNTKSINLSNQSQSPLIHSYSWKIFNPQGAQILSSTAATVNYTFADTGLYRVHLEINPDDQCSDSTSSLVRVYPGFFPDFGYEGVCFQRATKFTDASTSVYGKVNSWTWDFGQPGSPGDFSLSPNPSYTYPDQGFKSVQLIATDTKGCRDTVIKSVAIVDKPPITLAFRDTLICVKDTLTLHASGGGVFSWSPNNNIINANSASPQVYPVNTFTYIVNLDDDGCLNKDSVRVRVVDHVSLQVMNDTVICQGDSIRLRVISNGLQYAWKPSSQFINPSLANPICITVATTTYQVKAIIGGCSATKPVVVSTIPYPLANAGPDTVICFGTSAQLHGSINGISFSWSSPASLNNRNVLDPVAHPAFTTAYILSAFDNLGCPKPGKDTIIVTVRPKINAFAGRDTAVVIDQPLQMQATGGSSYQWLPPLYLSSSTVSNPVATFTSESDGFRYKVIVFDEAGCRDSSALLVKIYKTLPSVFVPSAFTPNNDGKNDLVRPIGVGIGQILFFNIYNRWGQLVFSTTTNGKGWDGKINGKEQSPGTFIWLVKALDYKGRPYLQQGTVTLIR